MRMLLVLVLLVGGALGGAWLGGEDWLAREAARRIEADPRIHSAAVTPLRQIDRIGLSLADVSVDTPQGRAALPQLDLWAAPTAPNEFHASLPPRMTVPVAGTERSVAAQDADVSLRVSPGRAMTLSRAAGVSGPVTVDGKPLLGAADVTATLAAMGAAAPRDARASYRLAGRVEGLAPAGLLPVPPALAEAGAISAEGAAQLFLTGPVDVAGGAAPPQVLGVDSDEGVTLRLGERSLRVAGAVSAGAGRRAEGAAFIYTADPRGWLEVAADLGAIPPATVALAGTALITAAATEVPLPPGVPAPAAPAEGEVRIPVIFKDGKTWLGPLALGPAPVFPG